MLWSLREISYIAVKWSLPHFHFCIIHNVNLHHVISSIDKLYEGGMI
jgi:hypothetical protein